jgi:hypothetical protein
MGNAVLPSIATGPALAASAVDFSPVAYKGLNWSGNLSECLIDDRAFFK